MNRASGHALHKHALHKRVRVGCAGWSIAAAHRGLFGDGESALARYATQFDIAEINSSFYRPHRRATYERWAEAVPPTFRFSVKVPRAITHDVRLTGAGAALDRFIDESSGLGDRLGCLLVQLPPSLAFDARIAATFFAMLRRRWQGAVACEPRHATWSEPRAEALLSRHRIARVAADPAPYPGAGAPAGAPTLRYWRLHGTPRIYYSAYDEEALLALSETVAAATADDAEAWVIFDNTAHGHATPNAATFQASIRR